MLIASRDGREPDSAALQDFVDTWRASRERMLTIERAMRQASRAHSPWLLAHLGRQVKQLRKNMIVRKYAGHY